jgi:hypothetical protein
MDMVWFQLESGTGVTCISVLMFITRAATAACTHVHKTVACVEEVVDVCCVGRP